MPVVLVVLKTVLRCCYHFHVCGSGDDEPLVKAPLTLVRAENPTELQISVSYNFTFEPTAPIEPAPSKIEGENPLRKYTWSLLTNRDGTMTTDQKKRIRMIWWEAIRHEKGERTNSSMGASVKSEHLKVFIQSALVKMGVYLKEVEAFAHYWEEQFKSEERPICVRLVGGEDVEDFAPKIEVQSKTAFSVNRFYFLFEPASGNGMDAGEYLDQIKPAELGSNAVIDLGGEIIESAAGREKREAHLPIDFNQRFIKEYIYA